MNKHTIFALAFVALLVLPGAGMAAVRGSPDLSVQFVDGNVAPGERTTVDVVVLNEGELDSGATTDPSLNGEVTTARGVTVRLQSGSSPIDVRTGPQAVGNVPEGASQPVSFEVVVPEDAEAGTHRVPVRVDYSYYDYISESDGSRTQNSEFGVFRVPLTVEERAQFEVVDVESNATVGSSGTVALTVENNGSLTARDTSLSLASSNPEVTLNGAETATRSAGRLEPGEQTTVYYSVTASGDADERPYPFTLTGEYEDGDGQQYSTSGTTVDVTPGPEQSFAVDDVSSTLRVGDDGELRGTLTNTGENPVEDVVLTWASEQRNVNPTETEYAVGDLDPGESREFDFDVEVSDAARDGPRQFSLVAEFEDEDGNERASEPLNVRQEVGPSADEFDVEVVNATVEAGGSTNVEVRLTNADDETLSDVSAKLFAESPISTTDDEAYVQSLEPGETATVVFGISAGGSALEKTYPLSMDFQYDEPDGDTVTTDTYRVPVQVTREDGDGGLPLGVIAVVLVLAALGAVAFQRYR